MWNLWVKIFYNLRDCYFYFMLPGGVYPAQFAGLRPEKIYYCKDNSDHPEIQLTGQFAESGTDKPIKNPGQTVVM